MTATGDTATSKLELIMGRDGLARLADSTVMVLGVGGVGSNCVEALARGGVGRLVVVDHDVVQASNINRQSIAFTSTIGRKKVDVARAMVADINPAAQVEAIDEFLLAENVPAFLDAHAGGADYVVDAIDTISAKLAIAQYADERGLRLISSMGAANKLRPECFRVADVHGELPALPHHARRPRAASEPARAVLASSRDVPAREGVRERVEPRHGVVRAAHHGQMIAGEVICALAGIGRA